MIENEYSAPNGKKITGEPPNMKPCIRQSNAKCAEDNATNSLQNIQNIDIHLSRRNYLWVVWSSAAAGAIIGGCLVAALLRSFGGN